MKRVYLIRHGKTLANERLLYCGFTDLPLSEQGKADLRRLRCMMRYPQISGLHVYTSGLRRTEQTLEELWGPVPHTALPELREMNFGIFEMRCYKELGAVAEYRDWIAGDNEKNRCPGGESGEEMALRVTAAFHRLVRREGDCLMVIHGGPIAAIMASLFPKEARTRYDWQPSGGMGYRIDFDGERPGAWAAIPTAGSPGPESAGKRGKAGDESAAFSGI